MVVYSAIWILSSFIKQGWIIRSFFAEGRDLQSFSSRLQALKLMDTSKTNSEYFFGALPCSSERQSELLNNLGRALWKLNNSLQHDEVSSQLGVPLVDSLLDSSIAWQAGGGKQSWGDEYVSVRGDHPVLTLPTSITSAIGSLKRESTPSAHFALEGSPSTTPNTRQPYSCCNVTSKDPSAGHRMGKEEKHVL